MYYSSSLCAFSQHFFAVFCSEYSNNFEQGHQILFDGPWCRKPLRSEAQPLAISSAWDVKRLGSQALGISSAWDTTRLGSTRLVSRVQDGREHSSRGFWWQQTRLEPFQKKAVWNGFCSNNVWNKWPFWNTLFPSVPSLGTTFQTYIFGTAVPKQSLPKQRLLQTLEQLFQILEWMRCGDNRCDA